MGEKAQPGFEWDPEKAQRNKQKHGVTFEEAATVFMDPLSLTIPDTMHSTDEDHFVILGESGQGRLLVVAHVERGRNIRIISARTATRHERRNYEENT
jgi:uncharacterized DUF497 family protein